MKKLLLTLLGTLLALPVMARSFTYEHQGQTLTYEITSEDDKTVQTIPSDVNNILSGQVVIPATVTNLGVEYTVTAIGEWSFDYSAVKEVTLPNTIITIGPNSFLYCEYLTDINIPSSVTTIGKDAFGDCKSLQSITIPNSVTEIGERAFDGCGALREIKLSENITQIQECTFGSCESLTSISIPNSVIKIGDSAFQYCRGLRLITFGNSIKIIDQDAFFECPGLTELTIPDTVENIGESAFLYCTGLKEVTIGNSVKQIGVNAFSGCSNLTKLTLPASLESIGQWAFQDCPNLSSVYYETENPIGADDSVSDNIFDNAAYENATLFAPAQALDKFKTIYPWANFKKIVGIESGLAAVTVEAAAPRDVYNLQGVCLMRGASEEEINALAPGLYIISGKKTLIR